MMMTLQLHHKTTHVIKSELSKKLMIMLVFHEGLNKKYKVFEN